MRTMDKFENIMNKYFLPFATKLSEQKHLQSIRDGLILSLPLVIVGSLFLVFGFLPIPGYNNFMSNIFGESWLNKLLYPVSVTFDLVSVIASIGIAYHLARKLKVDSLSASVISLASFFLVTPGKIILNGESISAFSLSYLGGKGLFVAIICALISTEIYAWFIKKNFVIKMPDVCPPAVSKSFSALIPALFILLFFWVIKIGKLSIGASLFNINEPVIFGSPIVLNPILMIPFIFSPIILTLISYFAISSGLVAPAVLPVPWTMPIILSGFISSGGHISSSLLQVFNLGLGILIYLPFIKVLDKNSEADKIEYEEEVISI